MSSAPSAEGMVRTGIIPQFLHLHVSCWQLLPLLGPCSGQTALIGLKTFLPFIAKQNHILCSIYWELSEGSFNYLGFFSL